MAEKKFYWIKLKTDFFSLDEIDFLLSQNNGCEYVVLYQMLCLNTANNNGNLCSKIGEMIIPYDIDKIVRETKHFTFDTVAVALELFKKLGLIFEQENEILKITAVESMVGSETSSAKRVREHRAKKALLCNVDVTQEKELDFREKSLDIRHKEIDTNINYQAIIDCYNDTCVSLQKVKSISEARKKAIKARLNTYQIEDIKTVFQKAQESDFLKGSNDRNWQANFDWLIKDNNFAKVLDGNYDNKAKNHCNANFDQRPTEPQKSNNMFLDVLSTTPTIEKLKSLNYDNL